MTMAGTLTAIHVYPVKSCGAVSLDRSEISRTGLQGDRLFQVVGTDGNPVTQRQHPELATVRPTFTNDGLALEADGRSQLDVAMPTANDTTANSLLGVPVPAGDAGDDAAAWFTDLLGDPVRLVAMTEHSEYRLPVPGIDMMLSWADACSVLVANSASLAWLNERSSEPFGMDRFRPNLTVDADGAWVEDTWRDFSIGAARFRLGIAWPRCTIPQVDQVDGSRHKEPAKVLKHYRWCSDASAVDEALRPLVEGNTLFGIGCSVEPDGALISVGDEIRVHDRGGPIIPAPT
jgi:uncharacterized protein YcbX